MLPTLLKHWRARRGMSLGALSVKSGVHIATLSRWESGTRPRGLEFEAVLDALKVPCPDREDLLMRVARPSLLRRFVHPSGQLPPQHGDLLRALRLRKGLTQTHVAHQLSVTQGMLAKWEKSEDWPTAERVRALCFLLDADEAEVAALLSTRFVMEERQEDLLWEEMEPRIGELMFESPVADLGWLTLEDRLWRQAARRDKDQVLLDYVYAGHARYLAEQGRVQEAQVYLERRPGIYREKLYEPIRLNQVMARSLVASQGGGRRHPERGVAELRHPLEETKDSAFKAWMQSEIAGYLWEMGADENSLSFSRESLRTAAESDRGCEVWYRLRDHGTLLNRVGRSEEALEAVAGITQHADMQPVGLAIGLYLVGVEALSRLRHFDKAQEWLTIARQKLEVTPVYLYRRTLPSQAALLAQQLGAAC